MKKISIKIRSFFADETGGEAMEYALTAGLIIVAAIAVVTRKTSFI